MFDARRKGKDLLEPTSHTRGLPTRESRTRELREQIQLPCLETATALSVHAASTPCSGLCGIGLLRHSMMGGETNQGGEERGKGGGKLGSLRIFGRSWKWGKPAFWRIQIQDSSTDFAGYADWSEKWKSA